MTVTKITFRVDVHNNFLPYGYWEDLFRNTYDRIPSYPSHDGLSTHSVGWIQSESVVPTSNGLGFEGPSTWSFGIVVDGTQKCLKEFLKSLDKDPELIEGITLYSPSVISVDRKASKERYFAESPILVRDENNNHLLYFNSESNEFLTRSVRSKLKKVGFPQSEVEQVNVKFCSDYSGAETKLVKIGDLNYKSNLCPVEISGPPALRQIIMGTGVGHLTGCSFGSIRPMN